MTSCSTASRRASTAILAAAFCLALAAPAAADNGPFATWLAFEGNGSSGGPSHGYAEIPHDSALNPTAAITIEFWVKLDIPQSGPCRSLVGKGWTQAYWVGVCGSTLRSYLRGSGSSRDGGTIPDNVWTHIAVTSDGVTRRHYINGVEVASFAAGGANTTSVAPVRIGSDVSYEYSPNGDIDEVRIWRIALTASEIQDAKKGPILGPRPGLIAVWSLDVTFEDVLGGHHGTGNGAYAFFRFGVPGGPWITVPGLPGFRFKAVINGTTPGTQVLDCVPETVCIAGVIPSRTEVFVRVIGPRPNGYLHAQVIKFTTSRAEVWIEQIDSGVTRYYELRSLDSETTELPGFVDKKAFLP